MQMPKSGHTDGEVFAHGGSEFRTTGGQWVEEFRDVEVCVFSRPVLLTIDNDSR